ncbi:MAG: MFS transporter, partial [Pseudarthrobacter sp.]
MLKPGIWRAQFTRYWAALTISGVGGGISLIALPVLAAEDLHASSLEVGYLRAAETVPYLLFALLIGALVDRSDPRRLMILADFSRAVLIALIPILLATSSLNLALLLIIASLSGAFTVLFDVAQFKLLPELVEPGRQTQANATLELTRGATAAAGPGVGGYIIGLLGPALAVLS